MKNFLIAFFVFLLWSIFGMWYYSCIIHDLCNDNISEFNLQPHNQISNESKNSTTVKSKNSNSFEYTDKFGNVLFTFPNNLSVKRNSFLVSFPEGDSITCRSIFTFLNAHQDKELVVTGLYNNQDFDFDGELGIKRANYIKDLLINFGVNPDRISVNDKLYTFNYNSEGNHENGIEMDFVTITENKRKFIESNIANKTLRSGFGSKEFQPDNTLEGYVYELKNYLKKYPNKTAEIIGHTDSTGDEDANEWFGLQRAKSVEQYLIDQGIDKNRVIISSKGESEPLESNSTIEGRRKNRRIEIKIH